jgi:hypothetical protein
MKKHYQLVVPGDDGKRYLFEVVEDEQYIDEWRANGLDIDEIDDPTPSEDCA